MSTNNPHAQLTRVPAGSDPSGGVPSISNTGSGTVIAKLHVDEDLDYIRRLGPGPLPWEERRQEATMPSGTPTVPPDVY